jgi:hypothetical protein
MLIFGPVVVLTGSVSGFACTVAPWLAGVSVWYASV